MVKSLTQVEIVLRLRRTFHRYFLKALSSMAQSYVDIIEKNKLVEKQKAVTEAEKESL